LAGFGSLVDTHEGDFSMMFRQWMIGTCVAVAAMVGGAVAEAQTETTGPRGHFAFPITIRNHGPVPMAAQVAVPEDEAAPADEEEEETQTTVAPYSTGMLYHGEVAATPKTGTRKHTLKLRNQKTGKVVFKQVLSMSKLQKLASASKSPQTWGYKVDIRRNGTVEIQPWPHLPPQPAVAP
jgi:hypothetical protein